MRNVILSFKIYTNKEKKQKEKHSEQSTKKEHSSIIKEKDKIP